MKENIWDVIIIGGGCAGLTASIYTARADLKTLIFANDYEEKGGLLVKTSMVENYPGFEKGILGYDLISAMEKQTLGFGTQIKNEKITTIYNVDTCEYPIFCLNDSTGQKHFALTVIVATGSTPNKLGLKNEDKYWGKGISSCAVCDGALYKNKKIVVVGGGDSAMEEANFLTKFSQVILIHRRDKFRASKTMQEKVLTNPKIQIYWLTIIEELIGTADHLTAIICYNLHTNTRFKLPVDGLFYGLGLTPNSALFSNLLQIQNNYILRYPTLTTETATSFPGIFVAGDVADPIYRQAIVACGDGCKAAMDVEKYLNQLTTK